ncbi:MAG TPA: oligosaccharide flippase family protein [Flavisolibacter sp.]
MDKKLLKWNFIFQYGWVLTNILNSILLLPLYLKNIDVNTLGIWLATGAILGWMTLVDPGVGEVLQQRIAELRGRNEKGEIGKLIGSGYLASAFVLLIAIVIGLVCYFSLPHLINKNVSAYPYLSSALVITILATGLSLVSFTMSGINQGLHNSQQVAICSLSANFLFLFTNLIFLFLGYGVLSIALANLFRAVFINIYNIISMFRVMKEEAVKLIFEKTHFKKFIRIFSFTSTSKIINGLAYSVDMIVLARFISPALITMYEVNRRPISISYSLIGRHSVALMPLISHAKGKDDKASIITLINQQFKFYMYVALFASLMFIFNHANLIAAWTGPGQIVSPTLLYLFVLQFFFSLVATFMANVDYALGDIKMSSLYNIVRGIFYGVLMFFAAKYYGIMGAVLGSLLVSATVDFFFFYYRVYKLGYLQLSILTGLARTWLPILPLAVLGGWGFTQLVNGLVPANLYFTRLLVNSGVFSFFFFVIVMIIDAPVRKKLRGMTGKYIGMPFGRLKRA